MVYPLYQEGSIGLGMGAGMGGFLMLRPGSGLELVKVHESTMMSMIAAIPTPPMMNHFLLLFLSSPLWISWVKKDYWS